jgi:hypothetical protein
MPNTVGSIGGTVDRTPATLWYVFVVRSRLVTILAWLDCTLPGTRGRLRVDNPVDWNGPSE